MHDSNILMVVPVRLPWQLVVFFCVAILFLGVRPFLARLGRLNREGSETKSLDLTDVAFELYPHLLTDGEHAFLPALERAIGDRYRIAMKVRLGDLVHVPGNGSNAFTARNKTWKKHVDFVICDHYPVKPRLAIELNDRSHANRKERDSFVGECLHIAGLPLLPVPCRQAYDVVQLRADIDALIR